MHRFVNIATVIRNWIQSIVVHVLPSFCLKILDCMTQRCWPSAKYLENPKGISGWWTNSIQSTRTETNVSSNSPTNWDIWVYKNPNIFGGKKTMFEFLSIGVPFLKGKFRVKVGKMEPSDDMLVSFFSVCIKSCDSWSFHVLGTLNKMKNKTVVVADCLQRRITIAKMF